MNVRCPKKLHFSTINKYTMVGPKQTAKLLASI